MFRRVQQRDKNNIALVTLELRRISAEHPMEFVAVRRDMRANQIVYFNSLLVPHERNHTEAHRLPAIILLVFGLLQRSGQQGCHRERFLAIDLAITAGAGNTVREGVRMKMDAACIAQGPDGPVVRNQVTELNDLWYAAEMFHQTSSAAERLPRQIVDGHLPVVEVGVRNVSQILKNEVLDNTQILTDRGWADLFVIAHHERGLAQIESHQGHYVTLASFVNDDDVE